MQNDLPPASDSTDAGYAYWPCTDIVSTSDFSASTWSGNKWHYIWSNRADTGWNKKPNQLQPPTVRNSDGFECRARYSSVEKANAATRAAVRFSLGYSDYAAPWVAAGGSTSDFRDYATLAGSPDTYFPDTVTVSAVTYAVMTDVPWLPSFRLIDVAPQTPGIFLDYEVQDDRDATGTTQFLRDVAGDIHAKQLQFGVWTNPLNAPTMIHTGLDATNLPGLSGDYVDLLSVQLFSGNAEGDIQTSYDDQIALLGSDVDYERLYITFELGDPGTSIADAMTVRNILTDPSKPHPNAVWFWHNNATLGGACSSATNQKISTICFGS